MTKEVPQRTCIGCRKSFDKNTLLRFVRAPDGQVVPDIKNKLPGRGAYTCLKSTCIHLASERKQFARAFKNDVLGIDPGQLQAEIITVMEDRIASYLALANKAGKVVSGSDLVADVLKRKQQGAKLVLLATDISEDIGSKIRYLAEHNGVPHLTIFNKDRFGDLLGKGLRSVVVIQDDGFIETLNKEIDRYRNFFKGEGCAE
jgi:uncharacterized protein